MKSDRNRIINWTLIFGLLITFAFFYVAFNPVNQPPIISSFTPNAGSPQEAGKTIIFTAIASDENNDELFYRFLINNRPVNGWTRSNIYTWQTAESDIGINEIEVQVRDAKHANADIYDDRSIISFAVISGEIVAANYPPTIESLNADQTSPQEAGKVITWTAVASDRDNDYLFYRFFINGEPATSWTDSNTWAWRTTESDIGDNQITVHVRDGNHATSVAYDYSKINSFKIIPRISSYHFKQIEAIVKDEYNNLPEGQMIFNCPWEMTEGKTEYVGANVSRDRKIESNISETFFDNITRRINEIEDPQLRMIDVAKIKIGTRMIVRLFGNNFEIISRTPDEQATINDVTTWKWSVTPNKKGVQKLFLTADIVIELPGYPDRITHLRELEKEIDVRVNPWYFIERNWQWIITTIMSSGVLGFILGWLIGNRKDNQNNQKDNQNNQKDNQNNQKDNQSK
jgi:hypothetical protein